MLALVEADDLGRDLSQARLLRDAAFERRVQAVIEQCAHAGPAPLVAPAGVDRERDQIERAGGLIAALGFGVPSFALGLIAPIMTDEAPAALGVLLAVVGLAMVVVGHRLLERARRRRRVRYHGLPRVATVAGVETLGTPVHGKTELRLELDVDRSESRGPDRPTLSTLVGLTHPYVPGARVLVRVDPEDPDYVVLAVAA